MAADAAGRGPVERIRPEPEPDPDDLPGSEEEVAAHLARAVELFDRGEYHAAHEVLDELWLVASVAEQDFFKGLIQASIALHHHARGNPEGARKLYAGHRRLLAPYLPRHRGIDVERFLGDMQTFLRGVVRPRPGVPPPAFEFALRPRLGDGEPRATG